uniref:Uncharacterized protein n=1 Tax=Panagrolaimus superbus TaxID=310955 RepID=A0A914YNK2_9BILA
MSETPLLSLTTSSQEESESLQLTGRILGSAEFHYFASKTKLSMDCLNKSLDKAVMLLKLSENVKELKAEMDKFRANIDHLAETNDSSALSELSTST